MPLRSTPTPSLWIRSLAGAFAVILVFASVASCKLIDKLKPHDGGKCFDNGSICAGKESLLLCENGKYFETACRGPKGCSSEGTQNSCDTSLDTEADKCPSAWEGEGSCGPEGAFVTCHKGHFEISWCRGKKGCYEEGGKVQCDMSIAREGDSCESEDNGACTEDHKALLRCKNGKMGDLDPCRGPKGCGQGSTPTKLLCDHSVVEEGDPCSADGGGCALDGSGFLVCENGKQVMKHRCRGSTKCQFLDGSLTCNDAAVGDVGDSCVDGATCSSDGKAFLECKGGSLVLTRKCACVVEGSMVRCK